MMIDLLMRSVVTNKWLRRSFLSKVSNLEGISYPLPLRHFQQRIKCNPVENDHNISIIFTWHKHQNPPFILSVNTKVILQKGFNRCMLYIPSYRVLASHENWDDKKVNENSYFTTRNKFKHQDFFA